MSRFFANIRIRTKILGGFTVGFAITMALGLFSMQRMAVLNETADNLRSTQIPSLMILADMTSLIKKFRIQEERYLVDRLVETGMPPEAADFARIATEYEKLRKSYAPMIAAGEEAETFKKIDGFWAGYLYVSKALMGAVDRGDKTAALGMLNSGSQIYRSLDDLFEVDTRYNNKMATQVAEAGHQTFKTALMIMAAVMAMTVVVMTGLVAGLVAAIAAPLARLTAAMRRLASGDTALSVPGLGRGDEVGAMAAAVTVFRDAAIEKCRLESEAAHAQVAAEAQRERIEAEREATAAQQAAVVESLAAGLSRLASGDLTCHIGAAFAPDYERLRADFNAAVTQLKDALRVITANTAAIQSGTTEVAQAADDLSRRTEQQAARLEETAAALDEITATVRKTADGARQAQEVVGSAQNSAKHSGQVMDDAVAAMNAIEASANQITQIIGVIDEIAFQTNLLALNAGVEAARAGDAGRGFAVVASEVRALAQRSAEAAKEIKGLISTSTQQVNRGVALVADTGRSLNQIVAQVGQISGVVSEIAASAQEQATGLAEVNTAVNQMDQMTQQNAAMVEQSTAASHALQGEAAELARLTSRFSLGEAALGAMTAPRYTARVLAQTPGTTTPAPKTLPDRRRLKVANGSAVDRWEEH